MQIVDKLVLKRQRHLKWRAFDKLELALMVVCGLLLFGFSSTVVFDIVTRTIGHPWLWLQEVTSTFFIYAIFIGAAVATRRNDHLYLTAISEALHGTPRLIDFGIAYRQDDAKSKHDALTAARADALRVFTPQYAAPEQLHDGAITMATDVYGLGALLYRLMTGHAPRGEDTNSCPRSCVPASDSEPVQPSVLVASGSVPLEAGLPPRSLLSRELAGELDRVLNKALATHPAQRYSSAGEMLTEVRAYLGRRRAGGKAGRSLS